MVNVLGAVNEVYMHILHIICMYDVCKYTNIGRGVCVDYERWMAISFSD